MKTVVDPELVRKLEEIDRLEKEIAPSGVSVNTGASLKLSHDKPGPQNPHHIADVVLDVLETRRSIIEELRSEGLLA